MVSTEPIEVAWQQLNSSEAYWPGFSGMLMGALCYSVLFSFLVCRITLDVSCILLLFGATIASVALFAIFGACFFLVVRGINVTLGWPLSSRIAAVAAAGLTGIFMFFLPFLLLSDSLKDGVNFEFMFIGPVLLISFKQAGAWLWSDREIRRFEQRRAFSNSNRVVAKKKHRFSITRLLVATFWLAGMLAIFKAVEGSPVLVEHHVDVAWLLFFLVFLSSGFTVILIGAFKSLRWLQKKSFYRNRASIVP